MNIINGWKITFGGFIGSTYAFNRLNEEFQNCFNAKLQMDDRGRLFYIVIDEEKETESELNNMYYFIKGYCLGNKSINFDPSHLFK
jgi:hypothetical protein